MDVIFVIWGIVSIPSITAVLLLDNIGPPNIRIKIIIGIILFSLLFSLFYSEFLKGNFATFYILAFVIAILASTHYRKPAITFWTLIGLVILGVLI